MSNDSANPSYYRTAAFAYIAQSIASKTVPDLVFLRYLCDQCPQADLEADSSEYWAIVRDKLLSSSREKQEGPSPAEDVVKHDFGTTPPPPPSPGFTVSSQLCEKCRKCSGSNEDGADEVCESCDRFWKVVRQLEAQDGEGRERLLTCVLA